MADKENAIVLLDDKRAREVARKKRVKCYGTISLLRTCYEMKIIEKEELRLLLDKVIKKGNLYITSELYDWVLR